MFILKYKWSDTDYSVHEHGSYRVEVVEGGFTVVGYYEDGSECSYSVTDKCVMYVANRHGETVDVIRSRGAR